MYTEEAAKIRLECLKIAQTQIQIEPTDKYITTSYLMEKAEELYAFVIKSDQ